MAQMIDMDDPAYWNRRKLVNKVLTPKRVRDQEASIRRTVHLLVDAICERAECDLVWDVAAWLPLIVIGDSLGIAPDRDQRLQWSDDMMRMLGSKDEDVLARSASMLRWVSPVKNMARTATMDLELGGQQTAVGDRLLLLYPSANRDEAVFENLMEFDLRRTPNDRVAFGFGTHFCLGANVARLELRVVLDELLERLPDLSLAEPGEPSYRPANFVSGYEGMRVRFTPTLPVGAP